MLGDNSKSLNTACKGGQFFCKDICKMGKRRLMKIGNCEKGSAILIVMALIAMLSAAAIISVDRSNTEIDLAYNQLQDDRAFYTAEAGLQRALAQLRADNSWRNGYYRQVLEGGYYTTSLTDSSTQPGLVDSIIIKSTGQFTGAVSHVELWVTPEKSYPFKYGLFGESGVTLKQDACTDSYNSDSGTYAATVLQEQGSVGANGPISLSQGATVGGDAVCATDGGISIGPSAQVWGDTSSTADSVNLDIIPDSEYNWAKSVSNAPAGLSGTNYTYNSNTRNLDVKSNGILTLQSGVYYFSSLSAQQNGQIVLAPNAEVTIYVTGNLTVQQDGGINVSGSPADMIIFSKGNNFMLMQDAKFYGAFYGPNVKFIGRQDMGLYGSIVASDISMGQDACFHYDRDLSKYTKGTTGKINVLAWRLSE